MSRGELPSNRRDELLRERVCGVLKAEVLRDMAALAIRSPGMMGAWAP